MQDNVGVFLCCGMVLVPFIAGSFFGRWFEKRLNKMGWPAALLPGFVRKILEDQKWK
jgi:hypothetical protein